MNPAEIVYKLNCYEVEAGHRSDTGQLIHDIGCGCDIWQGLILTLDEYDEAGTDAIDEGKNDRFALADGTVIRYAGERDSWQEVRRPGRPEVGGAVHVRLGDLLGRVDRFAAWHEVSRAEAIRMLIEAGLTASNE